MCVQPQLFREVDLNEHMVIKNIPVMICKTQKSTLFSTVSIKYYNHIKEATHLDLQNDLNG